MTAATQATTANEELETIVRHIVEAYDPERIILFGSYAYGTPDADSDLDLLVIKETGEAPRERRFAIRKLLWPLPLHIPVEPLVITPSELNARRQRRDPFIEEIIARGRLVYDRH